jgi:cell wall-associated NlpC family hydrolase
VKKLLLFIVVAVIAVIAALTVKDYLAVKKHKETKPPVTKAAALAYVKKQLGKPYIWGGPTLPGTSAGFDCGGLIWKAYGWAADLRTSQEQWARLHHVSKPADGDLVFFHGLLTGKEKPPGHVGIIVSPHVMIDAYAKGYPVEYDSFGTPGSKPGLQVVWGYAAP